MADKGRRLTSAVPPLLRREVVAQADYDSTKASYEEAEASLRVPPRRRLETSRLNLGMDGGKGSDYRPHQPYECHGGNLVNGGSGQATPLDHDVSIDPLYCYINVPESVALHYQELALQERSNVAGGYGSLFLQLENENEFSRQGVIISSKTRWT